MKFQAFEHYMLADDKSDYPMNFYMKFDFEGTIDRDSLETAVRSAMKHNPLMSSTIKGTAGGITSNLEWNYSSELAPPIVYVNDNKSGNFFYEKIDLVNSPGFRLLINESKDKFIIYMQIHHTAGDATAGVQLMESILASYLVGEELSLTTQESDRLLKNLSSRDVFAPNTAGRKHFWKNIQYCLRFISEFFRFNADPLRPSSPLPIVKDIDRKSAASVRKIFSTEEFNSIKSKAKKFGVSINDYLLTELFLTVDNWNARDTRDSKIRIAVAVNMRPLQETDVSASNIISMVFLNRINPRTVNPLKLLAGINAQMNIIKYKEKGLTLLFSLYLFGKIPLGMRLAVKNMAWMKCKSTVVLSNLGFVLNTSKLPKNRSGSIKVNGITLTTVELLSPIRDNTLGAFGVVTYNKQMIITLNYDEMKLSKADATKLLSNFVGTNQLNHSKLISNP
jgi:NRPS condensation-like uncharacterized protein